MDPFYLNDFYKANIKFDNFTELNVDFRYRYIRGKSLIKNEFFSSIKIVSIIGPFNRVPMPEVLLDELKNVSIVKLICWSFCPKDYDDNIEIYIDYVNLFEVNYVFENCTLDGRALDTFLDVIHANTTRKIFVKIIKGHFIEYPEHRSCNNLKVALIDLYQVGESGKKMLNLIIRKFYVHSFIYRKWKK